MEMTEFEKEKIINLTTDLTTNLITDLIKKDHKIFG